MTDAHKSNGMLMAVLGGSGDGEPEEVGYLWPCNVEAWNHWQAVQSQWRIGMHGQTGLDYAGVLAHLREIVPKRRRRAEIYAGIRAAEYGTLVGLADRKKGE